MKRKFVLIGMMVSGLLMAAGAGWASKPDGEQKAPEFPTAFSIGYQAGLKKTQHDPNLRNPHSDEFDADWAAGWAKGVTDRLASQQ